MSDDPDRIREHWEAWARSFGTGLCATTRSSTAKGLEVDALRRTFARIGAEAGRPLCVLEAGCGNGHNCVRLAEAFPEWRFTGFDYVAEMVAAAEENRDAAGIAPERFTVFRDDVRQLARVEGFFDIVLTVRCLINLDSDEAQLAALSRLSERVVPGGRLVMIENSRATHGRQNRARELLGLPPREPAAFNRFLDEELVRAHLRRLGYAVETEDFSSLHDLMLYALLPATNGGTVEYDHPLVQAAARLSQAFSAESPSAFGAFGQNRLFSCRKTGR